MERSFRGRVFAALDAEHPTGVGRVVTFAIAFLIAANVLAFILETVESLDARFHEAFVAFEIFSVAVFSVEYLARLWACTLDPRYRGALAGRLRFAASPLAIVDLLAFAPFYLALLPGSRLGTDLRFLRALRFFRLMRLFKLGRYSETVRTFGRVFHERRSDLAVAFSIVGVLLVVTASGVYLAEHDAQPERFANIPASMWWAIITLTTIGYGDIYPVTTLGKVFGAVTALLGVGIVALPTAILAGGFAKELERKREVRRACPHCGRDLGD